MALMVWNKEPNKKSLLKMAQEESDETKSQ